jgi:hypothetical protein
MPSEAEAALVEGQFPRPASLVSVPEVPPRHACTEPWPPTRLASALRPSPSAASATERAEERRIPSARSRAPGEGVSVAVAGRPAPPTRRLRPARLAKCCSRPRPRPLVTGDTLGRGGPAHGGEDSEEDPRTVSRSRQDAAARASRACTAPPTPHRRARPNCIQAKAANYLHHQTPQRYFFWAYMWAKRHEVRGGLGGGPAGPAPLMQTRGPQ